jgi:hypothetical protein
VRINRSYGILGGWVRLSEPWRARARAIDLTFRALRIGRLAGGRRRLISRP